MILVPGFASSGEVWTDVVAHYKAKYQCHVVTLAGFAGVPAANPTSLARVRDGIVDYIRAKKLDRPVLVGHSLGGFMAMWVASSAPDLARTGDLNRRGPVLFSAAEPRRDARCRPAPGGADSDVLSDPDHRTDRDEQPHGLHLDDERRVASEGGHEMGCGPTVPPRAR